MSKRKSVQSAEKSYARLCVEFDAAEAAGDVATAAGIYRQFAGSVHYSAHTARMHKLWRLR